MILKLYDCEKLVLIVRYNINNKQINEIKEFFPVYLDSGSSLLSASERSNHKQNAQIQAANQRLGKILQLIWRIFRGVM